MSSQESNKYELGTGARMTTTANAVRAVKQLYKEITGEIIWEDTILIHR